MPSISEDDLFALAAGTLGTSLMFALQLAVMKRLMPSVCYQGGYINTT
jgi:hypothetical protein